MEHIIRFGERMKKNVAFAFVFLFILSCVNIVVGLSAKQGINNILTALVEQRKFQGLVLDDVNLSSLANMMIESNRTIYVSKARFEFLLTGKEQEFNFAERGNFFTNYKMIFSLDNFRSQITFTVLDWPVWKQALVSIAMTAIVILVFFLVKLWGEREKIKIVTQVAHDIRSPIAALRAVVEQSSAIETTNREILNASIDRINSIAENLLQLKRSGGITKKTDEVMLKDSIAEIVREKSLLHPEIKFKSTLVSVTSVVQSQDFKRIISNLLNNSIEALDKPNKEINILQQIDSKDVLISIKDNGKGIPKNKIDQLFQEGLTFGKEKGNGLGLYHARQMINSWGGEIELLSTEGVGTTVNIKLPVRSVPTASAMTILIDDDPLVRLVWESKAKSKGVELKTYDSAESFEADLPRIKIESEIYIDRDLPNGIKGEEYAKRLFDKGFRNIVLATGHERDFFGELPHVKKIMGKEAPW